MFHGMVIYKNEQDLEIPAQLFRDGLARAYGWSHLSELKGFAMLSAPTSDGVAARSSTACPDNPAACIDLILSMFKSITSDHMPGDAMVYAAVKVAQGSRLQWQQHCLDNPAPDGVLDAVAHAFGSAEVNGVVEVVGDDMDAVLGHLLTLTDLPYVTDVHVMPLARGRVDGFGSGEARGVST